MKCVKILSYTIPMYGNKHTIPYGRMLVEHHGVEREVKFGKMDSEGRLYITFDRKPYRYRNVGDLYNPKFVFDEENEGKGPRPGSFMESWGCIPNYV